MTLYILQKKKEKNQARVQGSQDGMQTVKKKKKKEDSSCTINTEYKLIEGGS